MKNLLIVVCLASIMLASPAMCDSTTVCDSIIDGDHLIVAKTIEKMTGSDLVMKKVYRPPVF